MRRAVAALLVGLVVFVADRAEAQSPSSDDSRATELKQQGDDAFDHGRPADALVAYDKAYGLSHDPALLYNKGRAFEALGKLPEALAALEAFDAAAPAELKQRVPNLGRRIESLRQRTTLLSIACSPAGAQIRLRDRTIGTCPLPPGVRVGSGKAVLEVSADGYFPSTREIELPGGGLASFTIPLASRATSGVLVIETAPASATVHVDGARIGESPVETNLVAGTHAIKAEAKGYEWFSTTAVVAAGERRKVRLELKSEPSIFARWWFWAGAGLLVAGGVVTVVALQSEKDPVQGTIAPGVVTGASTVLRF